MADRKLTAKQTVFLNELLSNGNNAMAAYRVAYPDQKSISGSATKLRRHPLIVQAVERMQAAQATAVDQAVARYQITQERLADELARLALTRMPQLADVRTEVDAHGKRHQRVIVKDFAEADQEALAAIVEVKRTAAGEVSIKLADKRAAIMDLARLKGWIADKPVDNRQLVMLKIER